MHYCFYCNIGNFSLDILYDLILMTIRINDLLFSKRKIKHHIWCGNVFCIFNRGVGFPPQGFSVLFYKTSFCRCCFTDFKKENKVLTGAHLFCRYFTKFNITKNWQKVWCVIFQLLKIKIKNYVNVCKLLRPMSNKTN